MKYVLSSGWWCAAGTTDTRDTLFGDDYIRSAQFHELWYQSITRFTAPEKILVVDSASPQKPTLQPDDPRYEFISLNRNPGHSTNHSGRFSGYSRSILLGMEYALQCEADYYVFVEQDALLFGEGIIENSINKMKKPFAFGDGKGTPQPLQQSFFIVAMEEVERFKNRIQSLRQPDRILSPEDKFLIASNRYPTMLGSRILSRSEKLGGKNLKWLYRKHICNYQTLPFGYGRVRPINFDDPFFYFQHGTQEELEKYAKLIGYSIRRDHKDSRSNTNAKE